MTDSTLIEQAKLGDPEAIAALMNQSLQSKGLRAIVDRQGECLEVILEAERVPNRQALTSFVQKGISNLGIQSSTPITTIRILGRQLGAIYPTWVEELQLDASQSPVIPVDPLSIQSETAPPPVGMPGIGDFSSSAVTNASANAEFNAVDWMSPAEPAVEPLGLESLEDPADVAAPDFLQELLASSTDLPADDGIESTDEGLLDFLTELSDTPSSEPFPDEVVQELSSFEGTGTTEEGNFQELFAESSEFSLESELEPWEDSSETVPGGEADADLLDFLAAPPEPADDFNPQLVELHEFPDASSIDQLPESWLNDSTEAPQGPLAEPPADFLTSLLDEPAPMSGISIEAEPVEAPFVLEAQTLVGESWPEATPETGEDLQQAMVSEPLADPWAAETFAADSDFEAAPVTGVPEDLSRVTPEPELPEPELYGQPDYELSSVGFSAEPFPPEPPIEVATWIQTDEPEPTQAAEPFPPEPSVEASTWIQTDDFDQTLIEEEALPDFLLEPRLDLPETDPVEMTYDEALQQPDVLDATFDQEEANFEALTAFDSIIAAQHDPDQDRDPEQGAVAPEFTFEQATDFEQVTDSAPAAEPMETTAPDPDLLGFSLTDQVEPDFSEPDFSGSDFSESGVWQSDQPEPLSESFTLAEPGLDEPLVEQTATEPEAEPAVEPDLAVLSSFADQQSPDLSWTETSDLAVEEMPPDFLQELENEFLTASAEAGTSGETSAGTERIAATEPGWSALEADLAAMDLNSELPTELGAADSAEMTSAEPPVLNLEDFASEALGDAESPAVTHSEAADLEAYTSALDPAPELELYSETAEGTAVEPPADWLAALREPSVELTDAEPEPFVAEPAAVERSEPLSSAPIVSNVTQDELEAGLGDFREGFVEPLPQEFFEDMETDPSYADWRAELGDPLVLHEDGTESRYIIEDSIEDSEAPMPAVLPPPAASSALEDEAEMVPSVEHRSSEWIFPAVLLTVCGLLAGLLGFSLFSARIGPRQPEPPPTSESPAPPAPPASPQ